MTQEINPLMVVFDNTNTPKIDNGPIIKYNVNPECVFVNGIVLQKYINQIRAAERECIVGEIEKIIEQNRWVGAPNAFQKVINLIQSIK